MEILQDFFSFLQKNKPNSAAHYESGLRAISKDMLKEGIIIKPLEDMSLPEYEIAVFKILHNDFFIEKNTRGKRMYSNSLKLYQCFLKQKSDPDAFVELENSINNNKEIQITEREQLIKSRIGQGLFRDKVINKYSSCIISGLIDERLLVASHVKPWSVSTNDERLDPENGLLLSSLFDRIFDIGLISFENSGKVIFSSSINEFDKSKLGIDSEKLYNIKLTKKLEEHLEYHRDVIFIS